MAHVLVSIHDLEQRATVLRRVAEDLDRLVSEASRIADPNGWWSGSAADALLSQLAVFQATGKQSVHALKAISQIMQGVTAAIQAQDSSIASQILSGS